MNEVVVSWLNSLDKDALSETFLKCCGSAWWCAQMVGRAPFADSTELLARTDEVFAAMPREAWLEAFACHPKIGDLDSLRMRFAGNRQWSAGEQAGVAAAGEETLRQLAERNSDYQNRFGYLFIVCATGKTAGEMLALLETRLGHEDAQELRIAGQEQRKITHLRLEKMQPPPSSTKEIQ